MASHPYLPHTQDEIDGMLAACGVSSLDDLYADVDPSLRLKEPYPLPDAMSEPELRQYFESLGQQNKAMCCFAGNGFYRHHIPAVIPAMLSRSEFLTAYTPYQPEISQGTLQYIFEYQSMMCSLTGLDVCNASMYDGATATAEAALMAVAAGRRKNRILLSSTVLPAVAGTIGTYAEGAGITVEVIPEDNGVASRADFENMLGAGDVAGVIVASPNRYGILEDFSGWADACHAAKALFIVNSHASALAAIRTPGSWGADIACGEAQSLGIPMNYGGPGLGYLCCTKALMRKLPGRIVGATADASGRRCFVLTLQAREQHIRRQRATSNICSNQGMMTLNAAMYMSLMGKQGLEKVNRLGCEAAHCLADKLCATGIVSLKYPDKPFLNEFALETADGISADMILAAAADKNILAGVKITGTTLLVACTEMTSPDDIARYVSLTEQMKR